MRSTDPTLSTPVSRSADAAEGWPPRLSRGSAAQVPESKGSGRRRAADVGQIADETAPTLGASSPVLDAVVSPRRSARAAREAAAAAALSTAPVDGASAPVSPPVASPVAPATAHDGASLALAPAPFANSLAVGIPAPASSNGRRLTFVPADTAPDRSSGSSSRVERTAPNRASRTRNPQTSVVPVGDSGASRRRTAVAVVRRTAIGAVICGILATSILPVLSDSSSAAYASPNADGSTTVRVGKQTFDVAAGVDNDVLARDGYSATSVIDYEKQVIANRQAKTVTTYTGPTAAEYLVHPLYSHDPLDRSAVFQTALQYLGTPYVHGGADPSAFDCSGIIMFVYAQYGISLPHYVPSQDAMGTTIPESEAVPGDLVVFNTDDHDGFYAGNGMILDAPKPGGYVSVRPIWDAPHHFVRINP